MLSQDETVCTQFLLYLGKRFRPLWRHQPETSTWYEISLKKILFERIPSSTVCRKGERIKLCEENRKTQTRVVLLKNSTVNRCVWVCRKAERKESSRKGWFISKSFTLILQALTGRYVIHANRHRFMIRDLQYYLSSTVRIHVGRNISMVNVKWSSSDDGQHPSQIRRDNDVSFLSHQIQQELWTNIKHPPESFVITIRKHISITEGG